MFSKKNNNFEDDFGYANELTKVLLPALSNKMRGHLIQTEHLKEKVASLIDRKSGIDGLYVLNNDLGGLAIRNQSCKDKGGNYRNWRTFTIRYNRDDYEGETEYEKRIRNIVDGNQFYPHYTCQAYFDDNKKLLGAGFCFTVDLFDIAERFKPFKKKGTVYLQTNYNDNNTFVVVPFDLFNKFEKHLLEI